MPTQTLRFGISDGALRAATWKLWTPSKKVDVYLACRALHGELKASLHTSGKWHVGYTGQFYQEKVASSGGQGPKNRFVQEWSRPRPLSSGITLAYRILTPYSAVSSPIGAKDAVVTWLPNCPPGKATEIDIFLIPAYKHVTGWPGKNTMGARLVGCYALPNGDSVWVVYWVTDMPDLSGTSRGRGRFYTGKTTRDLDFNQLRLIAFSHHEQDGSRVIYDLAAKRDVVQTIGITQGQILKTKCWFSGS